LVLVGNYLGHPHPNPSPREGEGLIPFPVPLLPAWERGLGDEGKSMPE
jgi:hypothetical protein